MALTNGESILSETIVVTSGLEYFKNVPEELAGVLPSQRCSHTCNLVGFDSLKGRRCLIIGGRQSALEWSALISEQAGAEVHVVYRHDTPSFQPSDWSWAAGLVDSTARVRGWFRGLSPAEQDSIRQRFWAEGRLKVEPWLKPRIDKGGVRLWPNSNVVSCQSLPGSQMRVRLDGGTSITVDHVIFATGYVVDIGRVPYLSRDDILKDLRVADGHPILDEDFQSNIPGLFFTGLAAARDFGPFFGFVIGCPPAAKLIIERIETALASNFTR